MRRQERVHERFEVGSPPLSQCVTDMPFIIHALAGKLCAYRGKTFVEPKLESLDFIILGLEVVARSARARQSKGRPRKRVSEGSQLEESIGNLQHQDVWVVVFMADKDALARPSHAMLFVVLLQPL